MDDYRKYLITEDTTFHDALEKLNELALDAILFLVNHEGKLIGSLTDGDVRRGLLKGRSVFDSVLEYVQPNPKCIIEGNYSIQDIIALRDQNYRIIPIVSGNGVLINVVNFRIQKSYLPIDALVMAGGRGSRLRPHTDSIPKPLLLVGDKPIIDHNIDRLKSFGVCDIHISINYLGEQIEAHYSKQENTGLNFSFISENSPLGTLGAASLIENFKNRYVLVTNSDILTTMDYEDFFIDFLKNDADMSVVTIPYKVDIPYAVLETQEERVVSFKEKPTYTYYSSGGIYLIKKEILSIIPKNKFYNATDLMEVLIQQGKKLISYPIHKYWLDIGKPEDFEKANIDIKHLIF